MYLKREIPVIDYHEETPSILYSRLTCEDAMELGLEVCSIVVQILFQQIGDSVAWNPWPFLSRTFYHTLETISSIGCSLAKMRLDKISILMYRSVW